MMAAEKYKYRQIEEYIIQHIRSGIYQADTMLPTQQWFCRKFAVSRTTVNKAYSELVENGLIESIQGSGTYVRTPRLSQESIYMSSFTEEYEKKGFHISTRLLYYTVKRINYFSDRSLAQKLSSLPTDYVHYFERIRYADDLPVMVQYTYLTKDVVPQIPLQYLESSVYYYLEKVMKLRLGDGTSTLSVQLPTKQIASLLSIPETEPIVYIGHITRLDNGVSVEYVDSYINYSYFSLSYVNRRW